MNNKSFRKIMTLVLVTLMTFGTFMLTGCGKSYEYIFGDVEWLSTYKEKASDTETKTIKDTFYYSDDWFSDDPSSENPELALKFLLSFLESGKFLFFQLLHVRIRLLVKHLTRRFRLIRTFPEFPERIHKRSQTPFFFQKSRHSFLVRSRLRRCQFRHDIFIMPFNICQSLKNVHTLL